MNSFPQHFTNNDHNLKVVSPLFHFSREQQQQHLLSSIKEDLLSGSFALLIVHCLHIFQWHPIAISLLCHVHWPSLKSPHCELNSSSTTQDVGLKKKNMIRN